MKLPRAVLDVMRGATGAAVIMSVRCTSMGRAAPPPPPPASTAAPRPIATAPVVVLQPLPPLPRGADVPSELVALPASEPMPDEASPETQHASSHVRRANEPVAEDPSSYPPLEGSLIGGEIIGPGGLSPEIAANCGRG